MHKIRSNNLGIIVKLAVICEAFSIKAWVWKCKVYLYVLYLACTDQSLLGVPQQHTKSKNPRSPPNCLFELLSVEVLCYLPLFAPALASLLHSGGAGKKKKNKS